LHYNTDVEKTDDKATGFNAMSLVGGALDVGKALAQKA
jgi:hypothetical protein